MKQKVITQQQIPRDSLTGRVNYLLTHSDQSVTWGVGESFPFLRHFHWVVAVGAAGILGSFFIHTFFWFGLSALVCGVGCLGVLLRNWEYQVNSRGVRIARSLSWASLWSGSGVAVLPQNKEMREIPWRDIEQVEVQYSWWPGVHIVILHLREGLSLQGHVVQQRLARIFPPLRELRLEGWTAEQSEILQELWHVNTHLEVTSQSFPVTNTTDIALVKSSRQEQEADRDS